MSKIINPLTSRATPRITFSALGDALSQPAHRLVTILTNQKHPKPGPVFGYKKAKEQLVSNFINGTAINLNDPSLRAHEVHALAAAVSNGTPTGLWPAGATSASQAPPQSTITLAGVDISFSPDALLDGTVKKSAATGAIKLYLRKDPTTVGPMLAALLYFHRSQVDAATDPSLCAIVDVQSGIVHVATGNFQRLVNQSSALCQVIAATWPSI